MASRDVSPCPAMALVVLRNQQWVARPAGRGAGWQRAPLSCCSCDAGTLGRPRWDLPGVQALGRGREKGHRSLPDVCSGHTRGAEHSDLGDHWLP